MLGQGLLRTLEQGLADAPAATAQPRWRGCGRRASLPGLGDCQNRTALQRGIPGERPAGVARACNVRGANIQNPGLHKERILNWFLLVLTWSAGSEPGHLRRTCFKYVGSSYIAALDSSQECEHTDLATAMGWPLGFLGIRTLC